MSSLSQQCNPRANVFLMVNLGCEMLYVIDQRLQAQQINLEKSTQVIHDVTVVLLEPKFIDSLIVGSTHDNSQLLTVDHCKFMLNDIATSSIMRLDKNSMDKLWNLMTMIYKWQLFVSKHPQHLLDITFRHLDAISRLYPDAKRSMLVDFTKNVLLDFWNASGDDGQFGIYQTHKAWLQCFNTKISLLIRLGFQSLDGTFVRAANSSYFQEFVDTIGANVYVMSVEVAAQRRREEAATGSVSKHGVDQLAELLNLQPTDNEELQPIDASSFQKQFEQNLQQCNILFVDLDMNGESRTAKTSGDGKITFDTELNTFPDSSSAALRGGEEFVQLEPVYNRNTENTANNMAGSSNGGAGVSGLQKDLLDLYSKIK